jgi:hypothetical protein
MTEFVGNCEMLPVRMMRRIHRDHYPSFFSNNSTRNFVVSRQSRMPSFFASFSTGQGGSVCEIPVAALQLLFSYFNVDIVHGASLILPASPAEGDSLLAGETFLAGLHLALNFGQRRFAWGKDIGHPRSG